MKPGPTKHPCYPKIRVYVLQPQLHDQYSSIVILLCKYSCTAIQMIQVLVNINCTFFFFFFFFFLESAFYLSISNVSIVLLTCWYKKPFL
ncbi:hypothetical protein V8E52_004922 [Russula decolorans]